MTGSSGDRGRAQDHTPRARSGRNRPEEIARLQLATPFDPVASKETWLAALEEADAFARSRPTEESGCLYYKESEAAFVLPRPDVPLEEQSISVHFGAPGGVLPRVADG